MDSILALLKADDVKTFPSLQMPVPVKKPPETAPRSAAMRFTLSNSLQDNLKSKVEFTL